MATTPESVPAELGRGAVVVKAWAPWCGSCRTLAPHLDRAASTADVPVYSLQVDADPDLVEAFGVRSVPALIGLRDGTEVGRLVGLQPADSIEELFTATLSGTVTVTDRTSRSLIGARAAAGSALTLAGLVLGSAVLVAIGATVIAWAVVGLAHR